MPVSVGTPESPEAAVKQLVDAAQNSKPIMAYKAIRYLLGCDLETAKAVYREARTEKSDKDYPAYYVGFYDGVCSVDGPPSEEDPNPIQHSER
jgi:hypothetical protein